MVALLCGWLLGNPSSAEAFNPLRYAQQQVNNTLASGHLAQGNAWLLQALELDTTPKQPSSQNARLLQQYRLQNNQHRQSVIAPLPAQGTTIQKQVLLVAYRGIPQQSTTISPSLAIPVQQWEASHITQRQQASMAVATQDAPKGLMLYQALWQQLPQPNSMASSRTVVSQQTLSHMAIMLTFLGQATVANKTTEDLIASKLTGTVPDTIRLCQVVLQQANKRTVLSTSGEGFKAFETNADPWVAGLALWLQHKRCEATNQWDSVDGRTPTGYLQLVEQLSALKAYAMVQTMVQRGLELSSDGSAEDTQALAVLNTWQQQAKSSKAKAQIQVFLGNTLFANKQYPKAKEAYMAANTLAPTWDTPYLRLGELYEHLKSPKEALESYTQATELTPALMDSKLFAKKMQKLRARANAN
jgi:tetratricopeptide (TPR) repeat protein